MPWTNEQPQRTTCFVGTLKSVFLLYRHGERPGSEQRRVTHCCTIRYGENTNSKVPTKPVAG